MAFELSLEWGPQGTAEDKPTTSGIPVADALVRSLRDFGRVDMAYIARLIGTTEDEAARMLGDAVFLDPYSMEWQTSEEYLSGDLYHKLEIADKVDAATGGFGRNVEALRRALPPRVPMDGIHSTLGSPWIPTWVISDFIAHLMNMSSCSCEVLHDPSTGSWNIKNKGRFRSRIASRRTWGTTRMPALDIVDATLNGRPVRVVDEVYCPDNKSHTKHVLNSDLTLEAVEKQRLICEEFESWVWSDAERAERLCGLYNEKFCGWVPRHFDGSILEFPGMAEGVSLRPHQKDAAMRILQERNVLVAHDVGAGKTYTAIASVMELRRMGISKKNLIVVPNNVLGQWASLFREMYPDAKVLLVLPKHFGPKERQGVLASIRDGDYDAIIMAYSSFNLIPHSIEEVIREVTARIRELDNALKDRSRRTTAVKRERSTCIKKREKLMAESAEVGITFDQLGVTRLFVDEAHNYKNLKLGHGFFDGGISRSGSKMCSHMLDAVRCVQRIGGGVVFLTGTVVTNSIADLYVFQKYLQPGTLNLLGIQSFEAWCGLFALTTTGFEIDVDTSTFHYTTRFSGFCNLAELSSVLGTVSDFHRLGAADGLPECDGRRDVLVRKGSDLSEYLKRISMRVDKIRAGRVKAKDDNLLKVCSDGRQAALDIRLVQNQVFGGGSSKVAACAQNVYRIWRETAPQRSTQLVFCDISTPKESFNVYDELKSTLVAMGIPANEVAFVHDATTERGREKLFAAVREGEKRVLVGSTMKLGLGVNVQDRLVAAHHLDVPWRPSDMVQREGRILRQGNLNPRVEIYRYVTEGSFDAYSWQLLENKQGIIDGLLSATYEGRLIDSDVGDAALSYGEIKALAVNNPLLKERVEVANELQHNLVLQRRTAAVREEMQAEIAEKVAAIEHLEDLRDRCMRDVAFLESKGNAKPDREARNRVRELVSRAIARNAFQPRETVLPNIRYRGFIVVMPARMDPEKPYLWLMRNARHVVSLEDMRELGIMARLDHVLDGTRDRVSDMEETIDELYLSWRALEVQLEDKAADRTKKIRELKARLAKIDVELEVLKDEKR